MTLKKTLKKVRTALRSTKIYHAFIKTKLCHNIRIPHTFDLPKVTSVENNDIIDQNNLAFVWYVPYWTNFWGGGHLTIFRFAHLLSKFHKNIIYITGWTPDYKTPSELIKEFNAAFPNCTIEIITSHHTIPRKHIAIATTWQSVFSVIQSSSSSPKFYFMQDYESYFYAFSTQSIQANATYGMGLHGITGGPWLKSCFERHGGSAYNYIFSVDKTIFYPNKEPRKTIKKLFFYYRPSTERRCGELGLNILSAINQAFPEIEICIAGYKGVINMPFPATMCGNLTAQQTGELYRTCDVGIALSATNLSYLPVELMACGVPVLTNDGPNVEWFCKDHDNSLVCKPFPSVFIAALQQLIDSPQLRLKLINGGLTTIAQTSWEKEADGILKSIYERLHFPQLIIQ
jgi:glycosyltransferase involved in cell wall biosynthesis